MVNQLESVFDISAEADKAVSGGGQWASLFFFLCHSSNAWGLLDHDGSPRTARRDALWELSQP